MGKLTCQMHLGIARVEPLKAGISLFLEQDKEGDHLAMGHPRLGPSAA